MNVSPFNESENSKGVKVKPLIDRNNFVEENKGIKVNPLNDIKSCIEDKISPDKESTVVEKPRDDEKTEKLTEKLPGIFPASVVTRSMKAKKEAIKEQGKEDFGLNVHFLKR